MVLGPGQKVKLGAVVARQGAISVQLLDLLKNCPAHMARPLMELTRSVFENSRDLAEIAGVEESATALQGLIDGLEEELGKTDL